MKWILLSTGLLALIVAMIAGWQDHSGVLASGTLAFLVLISFANLDRISWFKASGSGLEAKTRDVIERAEHTVSELQSLASIVAATTLSLVKRSGRLGGYEDEEADRIREQIMTVLTQVGVSDSQKKEALNDWHQLTKYDYVLGILGSPLIPDGFEDKSIHSEWKALRSFEEVTTPGQLREFLLKWELLSPEREEYIKDYEYYIKTGTHRRPDVWTNRGKWGRLKNLAHSNKPSQNT